MADSTQSWVPGGLPSRLADGEVHVWKVTLARDSHSVAWLSSLLDDEELARARRFRFERDRDHFITARALLRRCLGRYLDLAPGAVRFVYGLHGKPALVDAGAAVTFNVSHSHGVALFAFSTGRQLGVDVEQICEDRAGPQIAERFFSLREAATLRSLPAECRTAAFFRCWTRKEAFIKAIGEGLSHPLDRFDVSLAPDEPAALLRVEGDETAPKTWAMYDLPPIPGFASALAVESGCRAVLCFGE